MGTMTHSVGLWVSILIHLFVVSEKDREILQGWKKTNKLFCFLTLLSLLSVVITIIVSVEQKLSEPKEIVSLNVGMDCFSTLKSLPLSSFFLDISKNGAFECAPTNSDFFSVSSGGGSVRILENVSLPLALSVLSLGSSALQCKTYQECDKMFSNWQSLNFSVYQRQEFVVVQSQTGYTSGYGTLWYQKELFTLTVCKVKFWNHSHFLKDLFNPAICPNVENFWTITWFLYTTFLFSATMVSLLFWITTRLCLKWLSTDELVIFSS